MNEVTKEFLEPQEAGELLSLSAQAVYRLCRRDPSEGGIPHLRICGRTVRIRRADLDAWIARNSTGMPA